MCFMGEHNTAEKFVYSNFENKKQQNARKSLENYVKQLKMHFDLNDKDIIKVLETMVKLHKNNVFCKKWWQIWK